eukprot:scaffold569_cov165-Amphora_coffeaeformis.AAC.5
MAAAFVSSLGSSPCGRLHRPILPPQWRTMTPAEMGCVGSCGVVSDRLIVRGATSSNDIDSVLSNTDIAVGVLLAFLLAALASFLQNQRSQNDFVLGPMEQEELLESESASTISSNNKTATTTTFGDWKEMSRPDNYVWYNTRPRQQEKTSSASFVTEQRWVLIALIALFAPIFSFEFFLTLTSLHFFAVHHVGWVSGAVALRANHRRTHHAVRMDTIV